MFFAKYIDEKRIIRCPKNGYVGRKAISNLERYFSKNPSLAKAEGYILNAFSYTKKEKKSKGEVIDDGYLVKVAKVYGGFWDGLDY